MIQGIGIPMIEEITMKFAKRRNRGVRRHGSGVEMGGGGGRDGKGRKEGGEKGIL